MAGLSDRESATYLDLLSHPYSSLSEISQRTGLHRPVLYALLPAMKERNLVFTKTKGKRVLYHASEPSVIRDSLKETEAKVESILPDLQNVFDSQGDNIKILHFHGLDGIRKIYEDLARLLPADGEYFAYTGKNELADNRFFTPEFWKTRDAKRLKRYVIAPTDRIPFFTADSRREVVYFQKKGDNVFERNVVKIIYLNRVAVIDFSQNTGVVIENPLLASLEKQQFSLLFSFIKVHLSH